MEFKQETITTKVDQLMELVKEVKEVSFEVASKKLGVPVSTIEAWASFLEEEGLLGVKYTLTTPFLVYVAPDKPEKQFEVRKPEAPKIPSVGSAYEALSRGDTKAAEKAYQELLAYYRSIPREQYELKREMEQDIVKLNKDMALKRGQLVQVSIADGSKRIAGLVRDSTGFLAKNDLENAERSYAEAKQVFESLPVGFEKEKQPLKDSLVRLFKEVSVKKVKLLSKKFSYLSQEIEKALPYFRHYVAEGKLEAAVDVYEQIKKVYSAIPEEFAEEKVKLQEQVLAVYDALSAKLRAKSLSEMQQKSSEINALLDRLLGELRSGQLELANQDYEKLKAAYNALPKGFLMEKTALQNRIVRAYEELVSRSGSSHEKSYREELGRVGNLLGKAEYCLHQKRFTLARKTYEDALLLYRTLPESREKSALYYKIASLRNRFIEEKPVEGSVPEKADLNNIRVKINALKAVAVPSVRQVVAA